MYTIMCCVILPTNDNETGCTNRRTSRKVSTDFERATFRDNFIPCPLSRLSVTTWRTIRFPCSCRTRAARCFLRGSPFVAWANVFYSIKQTRYLVGKLVRTQRCDVRPWESRASDIPADIQSLTSHFVSTDWILHDTTITIFFLSLFSFLVHAVDRNGRTRGLSNERTRFRVGWKLEFW